MTSIQAFLDRVLLCYSKDRYYDEVRAAKAEFFQRSGQVPENSDVFEDRMKAFLDWYLFDRPLNEFQIAPIKLFAMEQTREMDPDERTVFEDITRSNQSIFELVAVKNGDVYVKDLFDGEKYILEEAEVHAGFNRGDLFQGRLIPFQGRLVFGTAFVFHPKECRKFVLKEIKKIKYLDLKQRLRLMHRLSAMKLKSEQYAHIDVKHIYTETPPF